MFPDFLPFALFDDNLDEGGDLLLTELRECIVCTGVADLPATFAAIERARARGEWIALAASYELGYALEPRLRPQLAAGHPPLLTAWAFAQARHPTAAATRTALDAAAASLPEHARAAGVAGLAYGLDEAGHRHAVERIRALIDAGDCYQVNFTFTLEGEAFGDPIALYRRLRESQPVRHGAFIRHATGAILSRSPELFVERRGTTLRCRPMKGTAPRDTDPARLAASEKDRAENVMIVDLIRNDLGRLAPSGGVRVERLCETEAYPSVWQMTSTVAAEPISASLGEVFAALFPCGSVTGAPKIRAMEIIGELEHAPRGLYCGALGWLAPDGDFRLNVPIRTLVVDAARRVRLGLGSGIVADSDPRAEWAECQVKGRFLTDLEAPFGLIETLRCEPGADAPYPLLEPHLARLAAAAAHLCFALDLAAVRAALMDRALALAGTHRVRLLLHPSGRFELATGRLDPPAPHPTVMMASEPVPRDNPLARYKTTLRGRYDRALSTATAAGHFDVLFRNDAGELVEGARTNLFLDRGDGMLLTPPLECGALDGVYRRKLLAEGRAREAFLSPADAADAPGIYLANAVRGLVRVTLAP